MNCDCDEGFLVDLETGKKKRLPGSHDCEYIKMRNALIPQAEKVAGDPKTPNWSHRFNTAMTMLVKEVRDDDRNSGSGQADSTDHAG